MKYTKKTKSYILLLSEEKTDLVKSKLVQLYEEMDDDEIDFIDHYLNVINRSVI